MDSDLLAVKSRRDAPATGLAAMVRRVMVILSGSRGGSSLFKEVLSRHPFIASLDGEIDPLLTLSGNGFGQTSDSDRIESVIHAADLAHDILDEISFASTEMLDRDRLLRRWRNRLLLQFPSRFLGADACRRLEQSLSAVLRTLEPGTHRSEAELQGVVLSAVFRDEPWRINYYDGKTAPGVNLFFDEPLKIEEPPFVVPRLRCRPFGPEDAGNSVLLFKSPTDAYRIGMYEELFPNAEVVYLHLTRGFAQSVNGLMDGWLYPFGFFSHDIHGIGCELAIQGYSDRVPFGRRWWKFDLPPNWRSFIRAPLKEVCLNQWRSAHDAILQRRVSTLCVAFEDFVLRPTEVLRQVTDHLSLPAMAVKTPLPVTMATAPPGARRWEKRRRALVELGRRPDVREMMGALGYSMDSDTWS